MCKNMQIISKFVYELEMEHLCCLLCSKYSTALGITILLCSVFLILLISSSVETGKSNRTDEFRI